MSADRSSFSIALMQELMGSMTNWYGADNWDHEIRGARESSLKSRLISKLNEWAPRTIAVVPRDISRQIQQLLAIQPSIEKFSYLYDLLADEASRSMLIKVAAYRIMGHTRVKLPVNTKSYWSARESVRSLIRGSESIQTKFRDWVLHRLDLSEIGYPIEVFLIPAGVVTIFILRQYEYQKKTPPIKAQDDDYVIDAGGCWGDTALYFAHNVGSRGKVYSFEFAPDNLEVFHRNMELNPELSKRVVQVQKALWDKSGENISYGYDGPATSLNSSGSFHASTISIDDFVVEENLPRVDFIKMDIEGAELRALRGAERTIRAFRPKLAISLYHRESDFDDIPRYLEGLGVGYEFFLDHFTIMKAETVLFAAPRAGHLT